MRTRFAPRIPFASSSVRLVAASIFLVALVAAVGAGESASLSLLGPLLAIGALFLAAITVPRRFWFGVAIGVAVLAAVDVLPGPDLTTTVVKSGLYGQDFAVFALVGLLVVDIVRHRLWFHRTRLGRVMVLFTLINVAWWLFTLFRTMLDGDVVLNHAVNFGRDFLYIAILPPLFAGSFQRRETRNAVLVVVGGWSVVTSLAYIIGSFDPISVLVTTLLHVTTIKSVGSLNRLYAHAEDLHAVVFAFSFAACVLAPPSTYRRVAIGVAIVCFAATALSQTRAEYLGVVAGIVLGSLVYLRRGEGRNALRRIGQGVLVVALVVAALFVVAPKSPETQGLRSLGTRIGSISSTAGSGDVTTSTVAERASELQLLEQRLGDHWALGLGFVDPRDDFDPSLPYGTIRNTDVGLFNVVMTMGVAGTLFYYLSIVLVVVLLVARSSDIGQRSAWLGYGSLIALVAVIASSLTLVTFFGPTGDVTVAAAIGLASSALAPVLVNGWTRDRAGGLIRSRAPANLARYPPRRSSAVQP